MRAKLGTLCTALGLLLCLAAVGLFCWNQREARLAAEASAELLPQLVEELQQRQEEADTLPDPYAAEMSTVEVNGYDCIGFLAFPTLGLELPVMAEWDYVRLKVAPCRYTGAVGTDDLVVAGHNYTRHFGRLSRLKEGDEVTFTDADGVTTVYRVAAKDVLEPMAIEEMTAGEYDLTLFTCTYGGENRITIRCDRA